MQLHTDNHISYNFLTYKRERGMKMENYLISLHLQKTVSNSHNISHLRLFLESQPKLLMLYFKS